MKKLLMLFIVSASLIACTNQKQEGVTVSNGFTETKGEQVTMGSQESVDIFLKIDKAWKERDYDAIKSLVSKDAEFVNEKGEVFVGPQAFADYIEKDYQESLVLWLAVENSYFALRRCLVVGTAFIVRSLLPESNMILLD